MATTLYRCTGACQGVSDSPGTCQATECEKHEQPLTAVEQCEACAGRATEDNQLHACAGCKLVQ